MIKKFWRSKIFWLFLLALIGIGLFIFWFLLSKTHFEEILPKKISPEELKSDKFEPASQIRSPDLGLWQNRDFLIETLDEDLESGLDNDSCQYKVLSYELDGTEHSSGWQNRKCNANSWIGVGPNKWCRFEGRNSCWVFVSSKDKVGNQHLPAEEKGSVKYYHIDWTKPEVGKIFIEDGKAKVKVLDNLKVTACNLYLNDENLGPMSFLIPGCQKECLAFKNLDIKFQPGETRLFAICQDAAGNYGQGEELLVKENLPPKISSCRVIPVQGVIETEFQVKIEVIDPDEDNLSYLWNFGDGEISNEKDPFHNYSETGTFEPKVKVFDGRGGEDSCSTAWVVVSE